MTHVPTMTFEQARQCVLERVSESPVRRAAEQVALHETAGRVLAEDITADRDYPPLPRSARDGYAIRAADVPGSLRVVGEVAAGSHLDEPLQPGDAVEIMTGAPLPPGADAVVMVEHVRVDGDTVLVDRSVDVGENFNSRGAEARSGDVLLRAGTRIGHTEVALLATVGRAQIAVYTQPRAAILATGDELIEIAEQPAPWQIRNSNTAAVAAQVRNAGGIPEILPIARDNPDSTMPLIERGLHADLLLMSGGVSAGKYDIVESMLRSLGAEFYFDRVLIQPGQPLVFGRARNTFFFGLPGNPASTMVTFELFARSALELLARQTDTGLPIVLARLESPFRQRKGLTRFLPARLSADAAAVTPVKWAGSADVAALCRANAFLVTDPDREEWEAGELIRVLPKR